MEEHPYLRNIYIVMAAIAGAITSLSVMKYNEMSRTSIAMTVFVGTVFAIFVVPWFTIDILKVSNDSIRWACAATYIGGTVANAIIPSLIKKVRKKYGLEDDQ